MLRDTQFHKRFIKTWQRADDTEEVAKEFDMSKEAVIQLASAYRRKNVPLKKMRKGPVSSENWQELAALAKKLERSRDAHLN